MDNPLHNLPSSEDHIRVKFEPMGISCLAPEGKTVMEVASNQNILIRSDCGGQGQCGQCLVKAHPEEHLFPLSDNEQNILSLKQIQRGYRLACEARVRGALTVLVSDSALDSDKAVGKTLDVKMFNGDVGDRESSLNSRKKQTLGISIDIGTTTLAVYLCDLESGQVLTSIAKANPQRRFGEDVISRILYASENENGLSELQQLLTEKINKLILSCLEKVNAKSRDVRAVTVVGNTTMQHIFTGLPPRSLGMSPYAPVTYGSLDMIAEEVGLNLDPKTSVHIFPVISGFVGGDTVGVILSEKPFQNDKISLIIDIGTNGEIVLGNKNGLWVTSCATGPAFEGAHIECGMRASAGAIHKVSIDTSTFRIEYESLGKSLMKRPLGICGSGIIDAVAEMLRAGLVLPSGRLSEGFPGVVADDKGIGRKFIIVPSGDSSTEREIYITLADIRQVQLAKASLSVGIKLLMRKAGINHFDRLVLTGAFGARFNWKNAVKIGMLPEAIFQTEVVTVENAAGCGAIMALLNYKERKTISEVAKRVNILELAEEPDFAEEFALATSFSEMPF